MKIEDQNGGFKYESYVVAIFFCDDYSSDHCGQSTQKNKTEEKKGAFHKNHKGMC